MRRIHSYFAKMTAFYICFGMIPLVLISLTFFFWYYSDVVRSTENNYCQITEYLERNVSDLVEKADEVAAYLYEFRAGDYDYLYELLEDEKLPETQRQIYMNRMLQDMLLADADISSVRFYREDGTGYVAFRVQGKSPRDGVSVLNAVAMTPENMHRMILMPAVSEKEHYTNTDGCVFSVVRSYMKTANVRAAKTRCLGTLYIDIDVRAVDALTEHVEVGEAGSIAVADPGTGAWIYATDRESVNLSLLSVELEGGREQATVKDGRHRYFCRRMRDSGYWVIVQICMESVMDTWVKNRTYIVVVLAFTIFLLTLAWIVFSDRMNSPVRKLNDAMKRVQTGDLTARADICSGDEMEYLGEGFNRMVGDLSHYIDEVYVAKVCQKEAELNALKMQIQPHYLYNTLDVIRMTALENGDEKTARLLESLGKQLRYVIGQQRERVPFYMELDSIKEYMVLLNARDRDRFQVNINVSDQDRELFVLKLLLQPVIENCIRHGLRQKEGRGTIEIGVKRLPDCLEIVVMDDGVGMSQKEVEAVTEALGQTAAPEPGADGHVSIGLKNVYDRIRLVCGEEYGFAITSVKGMGTMVKYRLPIWEECYVENDHR